MSDPTHIAAVDPQLFQRLESWLADWLADEERAAIGELQQLLAGDPLAAGPLRALGADGGESDLRQRLAVLRRVYPELQRCKDQLHITASLLPETFAIYLPLAGYMAARSRQLRAAAGRAALFGINGAQGSGKTTINAFLQIILTAGFGQRVAGLSIDDVYKTFDERAEMARRVHPLFAIRSVAGTHDTSLALDTLTGLLHAGVGTEVALPRFDKAARGGAGDRLPAADWPVVEGPLDIVIFEGWCVGARPQPDSDLVTPVNAREARDDPDGTWRRAMNHHLATDYRELFALLDELFVIEVRGMADVYRNRELQEQQLRRELAEAQARGADLGGRGAMSPAAVVDFISLYERTTRHMLATLPATARLTLSIGDHHRIERLRVNEAG